MEEEESDSLEECSGSDSDSSFDGNEPNRRHPNFAGYSYSDDDRAVKRTLKKKKKKPQQLKLGSRSKL